MTDYRVNVIRNGGIFKELNWDTDNVPEIVFNSQSMIKCSLRGRFIPDQEINYLKDELQPILITEDAEYPLGIFRASTVSAAGGMEGSMVSIEAFDRCWLLDEAKTENIIHISAGAAYISEIEKLLTAAGIYSYLADPSDAVFSTDREDWPVGTSRLKIINQLLEEMGFEPVFFDNYGTAQLRRYRPPSAEGIVRHYSATDVLRLPMGTDYRQETDIFDSPNVFICICSNADNSGVLTATAENNSPLSDKSIINRGLRIPKITKIDQVAGQAELQTIANRFRDESLLSGYTTGIEILPEAGHLLGDVVSVDHPDIGGIYREQSWSMSLSPEMLMRLSLHREVLKADEF